MCLVNTLITYRDELKIKFETDADKVLLLKTATILYPVLAEKTIKLIYPIAITCEDEWSMETIFHELQVFELDTIYTTALTPKKIRMILKERNTELFSMKFTNVQMSAETMRILEEEMIEKVPGKDQLLFPVIAFLGYVPPKMAPHISGGVRLNKTKKICKTDIRERYANELITYCLQNMPVISKILDEALDSRQSRVFHVGTFSIIAAAEILIEYLVHSLKNDNYKELFLKEIKSAIVKMKNEWEDYFINSAWADVFRRKMLQSADYQLGILNREKVLAAQIKYIDMWPLQDDKYYYLSEQIFNKICEEFNESISQSALKQILSDEGVLIGEGKQRNYWSIKCPIVTEYGAVLTPRKIKIRRSSIDLPGELTWQQRIEMRRSQDEKDCSNFGREIPCRSTGCR